MASPVGTWYRLTASVGEEDIYYETHLFLAHLRLRSPKVALFVFVDNVLGQFSLRATARGFAFASSSMLAKACIIEERFQPGAPNPSITLTRLKCKNISGILHSVTLDSAEEPAELWKAKVRDKAKCKDPGEGLDDSILAGFDALAPKVKRARAGNGDGGQGSSGGGGPVGAPSLGDGADVVPAAEDVALQCGDELQEWCGGDDSEESDFDADAVADSCLPAGPDTDKKEPMEELLSKGTDAPKAKVAKGGSASGPHEPWWVTRAGRQAKCSSCGESIAAHGPRVLYQPDKADSTDHRVWRDVWWRYYHLDRRCIPAEPPDFDLGLLRVDFKPLPQKMKETPEQYREAQEDAAKKFGVEFPLRCGVIAKPK